jgi:hypothetical protein
LGDHVGSVFDDFVKQQRTQQSKAGAHNIHRIKIWQYMEQSGFYFDNRLLRSAVSANNSVGASVGIRAMLFILHFND